jgi:hypothetical protein
MLAGPLLNQAYEETKAEVTKQLKEVRGMGGWVMVATDSWKRRIAVGGAPLLNAMLLLPDGGSFFYDVINTEGIT